MCNKIIIHQTTDVSPNRVAYLCTAKKLFIVARKREKKIKQS